MTHFQCRLVRYFTSRSIDTRSRSYFLVMYTPNNHIWANTGVVERGVESTTGDLSVYPCVGSFTSPGIDTR